MSGRALHPASWAVPLLAAILLVGCGPSGRSPDPSPRATATSASSADAASASTPTPTPTADPMQLAVSRIGSLDDSVVATFEGTIQVGDEQRPVTGEYRAAGADFHVVLALVEDGASSTTEQIVRGGANFVRADDGGWTRHDVGGRERTGVVGLLAQAIGGRSTEHARLAGDSVSINVPDLDVLRAARLLGLADRNARRADGVVTLHTEFDGSPRRLDVSLEVETAAGDATLVTTWELVYDLQRVGGPITIERPAEAWRIHTNAPAGYVFMYPDTWLLTQEMEGDATFDLLGGPDGREMQVHTYAGLDGITADRWFAESAFVLERDLGSAPRSESITVGGRPAVLFTLDIRQDGEAYFFQQAVIFATPAAWDVNWWSPPGDEEEDRRTFEAILARFTPLSP